MSVNETVEKTARAHSGMMQLAQTLGVAFLIFVASSFYGVVKENRTATVDQSKAIAEVTTKLATAIGKIGELETDLKAISHTALNQARNEEKIAELERRVTALEARKP